ncbi:MAG: 3-deoxy-D-manno-octulosonic acid transferase [Blastocatellia bacterium]|nr:3-deoxy-D-manno-octulosonic acid transferase [Blastocatellia bacterium]
MARFPFLLYNLALLVSVPFLLPYYGFRAFKHGKYIPGLKERFGYFATPLPASTQQPTIWIHAVSVGEVLACRPLALGLREAFPNARLIISTTTETGQARAYEQLAWADRILYFPLDFPGAVRRALDFIRPDVVVILETEIWPNFLRQCRNRKIPVVLVNGRLSDRSFRRYGKVRSAMQPLLEHFDLLLMQSEADAERIRRLGAPPDRVKMIGNLKYEPPDAEETARRDKVAASLDAQFNLSQGGPLMVAGSTVENEEHVLVGAFLWLRKIPELQNLRLLVAPRHPQRFAEVAQTLTTAPVQYIMENKAVQEIVSRPQAIEKLKQSDSQVLAELRKETGIFTVRRSVPHPESRQAPIIFLDTVGELAAVYRFAEVVFVGGSLVPRGGHNILEPASDGRAIVTGAFTSNFREIMHTFRTAQAVRQLESESYVIACNELRDTFYELLTNPDQRHELGRRARLAFESQSGATAQAVAEITTLL